MRRMALRPPETGVRVARGDPPETLERLIEPFWRHRAPKRLVAAFDESV